MTLARVASFLRQLRRLRRPLAAKAALRDLRVELEHTALDAYWQERLADAFETYGEAPPATRRWRPEAGESHVLLFAPELSEVGRLRIAPTDKPAEESGLDSTAKEQLRTAYLALARLLGHLRCGTPRGLGDHEISLDRAHATTSVEGASLGLPACIALLSCWLGVRPRFDTAATASVTLDGRVLPVHQVAEKARVLGRAFPEVRRLLVATGTPDVHGVPEHIELCRVGTLAEALEAVGLHIDSHRLPPMSSRSARIELNNLDEAHVEDHRAPPWASLSERAFVLAQHFHEDPIRRTRAMAHAATFSLHAGFVETARAYLAELGPIADDIDTATRVQVLVARATTQIDAEPSAAVAPARAAVDAARTLGEPERSRWLGRALGTWGRALLHGGASADAVAPLREALEFHRSHAPEEGPRSAVHLATALRHAGSPDEALELCQRTSLEVEEQHHDEAVRTTGLFLELEAARCHLANGDATQAACCAQRVVDRMPLADDATYPKSAALRVLAQVAAISGRQVEAERIWSRCLRAVEAEDTPTMLRRIAAYALGDALLLEDAPELRIDRDRFEAAWRRATDGADIEPTLAAAVY